MTKYEFAAILISGLSAFFALISIIIAGKQRMISQGEIELQIHQMVSQTKKDLLDITLKASDVQSEILNQALQAARKLNLNAYDEACSKYLDGKVDRDRFKKNYHVEIRQLVEDANNHDKFDGVTSKYKCILSVYDEWNNLEAKS